MTIPYFLQIAGMFLIPLIAVLVPVFIGQRYGIYSRKKSDDIPDTPIGTIVGGTLGLLGFMLAFTFQIATSRYAERKKLLLEEVTNIRTGYLRAGLIPEPYRANTKNQLVEYVDLRTIPATELSELKPIIARSQQILDSLWGYTEALAVQDRSSEIYALYTSSINDIVSLHNQRISMALEYRIPGAILLVLFIIGFLSMLVLGYQFGISGKTNFTITLLFAIIFAVVMFLILALDRPETGLMRPTQKPMFTLQQQLHGKQLNK